MVTGTTQNLLVFRGNQTEFLDLLFGKTLCQNSTAPNSVNSSIYSELRDRDERERGEKKEGGDNIVIQIKSVSVSWGLHKLSHIKSNLQGIQVI